MMIRLVSSAALAWLAALAVCAGSALAGGFATVGLTSPPPQKIEAGESWEARFAVLAHGRTPIESIDAAVRIERQDGDGARTFPASVADTPGEHRARVVFPAAGRWSVEVLEYPAATAYGTHSFGEVDVEGPASAGASSWHARLDWMALAVAVALGLLAGGAAWLIQGRPRSRSAAGVR